MAKHSKTMVQLASKLALGEEEKVLSKAAEFERLLQMKTTANSNITDTGKVIICLDLAAQMYGVELDMKTAIKYAGVKSSAYVNTRKVVQNLLELNTDRLTTEIVCASLQCNGVQGLTERILAEYQATAKMELDLSFPQYVCMAVYQACRINKVKVSKSKLIEKSRLKPAQWTKLEAEWTKFVDGRFAAVKNKKGRPGKNVTAIEEADDMETELVPNKKEEPSEPQTEPYEEWKKRILNTAYSELKALQSTAANKQEHNKRDSKQQQTVKDKDRQYKSQDANVEMVKEMDSPRRSPRKAAKYEPYQSPNKNKGVRLLFPLDSQEKIAQKSEKKESASKIKGLRLSFSTSSLKCPQTNSLKSPQKMKSPHKSKSPSRSSSKGFKLVFPSNL